ncbi:hypothetical protein [Prochlorococcus marinus]|nr:hypothetical protein [Prochlorococcus marinus]
MATTTDIDDAMNLIKEELFLDMINNLQDIIEDSSDNTSFN